MILLNSILFAVWFGGIWYLAGIETAAYLLVLFVAILVLLGAFVEEEKS